jgi:hypothetical protein
MVAVENSMSFVFNRRPTIVDPTGAPVYVILLWKKVDTKIIALVLVNVMEFELPLKMTLPTVSKRIEFFAADTP